MRSCERWNRIKPPSVRQVVSKRTYRVSDTNLCSSQQSSEKPQRFMMSAAVNPKDISDCISCWLAYLQMLNGLCSAGSRLSQCLCGLARENHVMAAHCQAVWEELVRASTVASSNIKSNVLTALQELSLVDNEGDRPRSMETNQAISNSLAAFIHLQYQLCAASCETLKPVLGCPCPPEKHEADCSAEAMHQCFQRLFAPPARSPLPLAPFTVCQRRWSEAAAQDVSNSGDSDGTMRRWSMPWENSKVNDQQAAWPGSRLVAKNKLTVPGGVSQDRSRSTTPESALHSSMASQEELQEVIQLLSYPISGNSLGSTQPAGKSALPGVVLTGCGFEPAQAEAWSESTTPSSRRGSSSPHRGALWQGHGWSEGEVQTPSGGDGNYELSPAAVDSTAVASRKSSSSTDSSSSYSLHSRSTTGSISAGSTSDGPQEARPLLYSMWSGADLPFIKLPESSEMIEETPTDDHQNFFKPNPI